MKKGKFQSVVTDDVYSVMCTTQVTGRNPPQPVEKKGGGDFGEIGCLIQVINRLMIWQFFSSVHAYLTSLFAQFSSNTKTYR